MRWIFLTLVLLNILVLAVQWTGVAEDASDNQQGSERAADTQIELLRDERHAGESRRKGEGESLVGGSANQLCLMVGPADTEVDAQAIMSVFGEFKVPSKIITNEVKRTPDYWVYLPPFESRNAAIKKLRELQQLQKVDSFLISQGPLANGISLGLFKSFESASQLQKERVSQGMNAKLAEVERTASEFWVVAKEPIRSEIVDKIFQTTGLKGITAERRQIFCKSVASN